MDCLARMLCHRPMAAATTQTSGHYTKINDKELSVLYLGLQMARAAWWPKGTEVIHSQGPLVSACAASYIRPRNEMAVSW